MQDSRSKIQDRMPNYTDLLQNIYTKYHHAMKSKIYNKLSLIIILLLSSGFFYAQDNYAIQGVNIIPMDEEIVLTDQTVLVKEGKIESIGPVSEVKIPKGYSVINAKNKYLVPGFFDMHVHFFQEQYSNHLGTTEAELKLMLANGLTTVRILAGHPDYLTARENVRTKIWEGPQLLVASPQLVGAWPWPAEFKNYEIVNTPEKAAASVKAFKSLGYDAIKITFMVNRECYDAIVTTANELHMKVVGHVGPKVKLPAALKAGQQIEHMDEFIEMLLPDSSYNHGQCVSDMNIWRKKAWATVPALDETKLPALVQSVKDAGVYITPTNYFFVSTFGENSVDDKLRTKPDFAFIPKSLVEERWKARTSFAKLEIPGQDREKYIRIRRAMVVELWKAGVPLMAGSDSPEFFLVAGFALHNELEELVAAGLSPFAALQAATTNPANYLGVATDRGTISVGKEADLVLLDKNPLSDIKNSRSVRGVFNNGKYYDRALLDEFLESAKRKFMNH